MARFHAGTTVRVSRAAVALALLAVPLALAAVVGVEGLELKGKQTRWDSSTSVPVGTCTYSGEGYTPVQEGRRASHDDGFDGGLVFGYGDTFPFIDSDGQGDLRDDTLRVGPEDTGGRPVARIETAGDHYLRSLIKLKNPSGSNTILGATWASDLGSDGTEAVRASSSGNQVFTAADRWVVSSLDPPIAEDDDPPLTFVLYGKGDVRTDIDTIDHAPDGSGCITVNMRVRLRAETTRYLLFFTEMNASVPSAKAGVEKFDHAGLSSSLLEGISPKVQGRILNWDL